MYVFELECIVFQSVYENHFAVKKHWSFHNKYEIPRMYLVSNHDFNE